MTVSVSDRQSSNYSGPQSSGHEYEFSFRLHDASMLYVEIMDGDGVKTEADPNDYSVTLNYDQYGNPGGIVTYDLALLADETLQIISRLEIQQQSELTATPSYVPRNVEDALDYLAMVMQDQSRLVDASVGYAQDSANAAAASAESAAASEAAAEELSTLQAGTPTNVAIAENDQITDALWKTQGQINSLRNVAFIDLAGAPTYTMTEDETAAQTIIFASSANTVVTSTSTVNTVGLKIVFSFNGDLTLDGLRVPVSPNGFVYSYNDGSAFQLVFFSQPAPSTVRVESGTSYDLDDLVAGSYYIFDNAAAVTINIPAAAVNRDVEFYFERRGAGDLTIVPAMGVVTVIPPKGGSLVLEDGDFCTLKCTSSDEYKLNGSTQ